MTKMQIIQFLFLLAVSLWSSPADGQANVDPDTPTEVGCNNPVDGVCPVAPAPGCADLPASTVFTKPNISSVILLGKPYNVSWTYVQAGTNYRPAVNISLFYRVLNGAAQNSWTATNANTNRLNQWAIWNVPTNIQGKVQLKVAIDGVGDTTEGFIDECVLEGTPGPGISALIKLIEVNQLPRTGDDEYGALSSASLLSIVSFVSILSMVLHLV